MEMDDLTKDMRLVAEVIGEDATKQLMRRLGGIYIYIPKPSRGEIAEALKENGYDTKMVAAMFGVSQRKVEIISKEVRTELKQEAFERRQQSLFDLDELQPNNQ